MISPPMELLSIGTYSDKGQMQRSLPPGLTGHGKSRFDSFVDQIRGYAMLLELSNNAGLADIKELGHLSGGSTLPLGGFEHLLFQRGKDICQIIDSPFLLGGLAPLV